MGNNIIIQKQQTAVRYIASENKNACNRSTELSIYNDDDDDDDDNNNNNNNNNTHIYIAP